MAKRVATGVAAFNVGDCVVVRETALIYPGYIGKVIRLRTGKKPIVVRVRRTNGRDMNYPFSASEIEKIDSCPDEQPEAAVRVESGVVAFDAGDCVVVREIAPSYRGHKGRIVEIRKQEPTIVVRLWAKTDRWVLYSFEASHLEKIRPCPDGWQIPSER